MGNAYIQSNDGGVPWPAEVGLEQAFSEGQHSVNCVYCGGAAKANPIFGSNKPHCVDDV